MNDPEPPDADHDRSGTHGDGSSGRHRPPSRPSVALVLGGGGVAGAAYHAGAVAALAEATGWDPRQADLIVGTSAGAGTAASLRAGLSPADHLARATGSALSDGGRALVGDDAGPPRIDHLVAPPRRWSDHVTGHLPQAPWLVGPALLRPGPTRWGVALAGLVPPGRLPTDTIGERIRRAHDRRWPTQPTWIVAYRTRDARRVVFGRDDVEVPDLATVVEASSAVPGRFRPVCLPSGRYLDGAVHSPTNADVVAPLAFDLVVVSAPMSAAPDARPARSAGVASWPRAWFGRLLDREVAAIRDRGTAVLVLEPGPAELLAIRSDLPDRQLGPLVAEATHQAVHARLGGGAGHDREAADDGDRASSLDLLTQAATT